MEGLEHSSSSPFQLPSSSSSSLISSDMNDDLINLYSGTVIPFWSHPTLGLFIGSDSRSIKIDGDTRTIESDQTCKNYCLGKEQEIQVFSAGSTYIFGQTAKFVYRKYQEIAAIREIIDLEDLTENIFIPSVREAFKNEVEEDKKLIWLTKPTSYVICNTFTTKKDKQFMVIHQIHPNLTYGLQPFGCIGSGSNSIPKDFKDGTSDLSPNDLFGIRKMIDAFNHAISSDENCGGAPEIYVYTPLPNGKYELEYVFDDCPSLCADFGVVHLPPAKKNIVQKPELLSFRWVLDLESGRYRPSH